jgi:DNA-binding CsgD family transcriptional regulator
MTENSGSELTPREKSVLELLASDRRSSEMASAKQITEKSVLAYLKSARMKLRRLAP